MGIFTTKLKGEKALALTIVAKLSILDVCLGIGYASADEHSQSQIFQNHVLKATVTKTNAISL